MADPISWYNANADAVLERYEAVDAEAVHGWLVDLLPSRPAAVLDVGAGSGRDAGGWHHWGMTLLRLNPRRNCGPGHRPFMRTVRSVGSLIRYQVFDTSSGLGCASTSSS